MPSESKEAAAPEPARTRGRDWIGPTFATVGVLGFSFKAILIKLAYAWAAIDALTLLTLRMLYSAPIFLAMALLAPLACASSRSPLG